MDTRAQQCNAMAASAVPTAPTATNEPKTSGDSSDSNDSSDAAYAKLKRKLNEIIRLCNAIDARVEALEKRATADTEQRRMEIILSISKLEASMRDTVSLAPTPEQKLLAMLKRELEVLYAKAK